jgi:hypothetical protein
MATQKVEVTASNASDARSITVEYDFGDNLKDAVARFGEQTVFEYFEDNARIALQGMVRNRLKKEGEDKYVSDEKIHDQVNKWMPGAKRVSDPAKKAEQIKKAYGTLDRDAKRALVEAMQKELEELAKLEKPALRKGKKAA